jgi:hypothetical protein
MKDAAGAVTVTALAFLFALLQKLVRVDCPGAKVGRAIYRRAWEPPRKEWSLDGERRREAQGAHWNTLNGADINGSHWERLASGAVHLRCNAQKGHRCSRKKYGRLSSRRDCGNCRLYWQIGHLHIPWTSAVSRSEKITNPIWISGLQPVY